MIVTERQLHERKHSGFARRSEQGQSLLIALSVLLILSFVGTIFVAIVGRNLQNSQQSNRTSSADTYAQAGIDFADNMLQTAPEGADWRPPLQYVPQATSTPGVLAPPQVWITAAANQGLSPANANDPDVKWLNQGFTRYNVGNGRFLLRVSYLNEVGAPSATATPVGASSGATTTSKFLKIESVGVEGTVNPDDPTATPATPGTRRSERVAYKPICLGDYTRFITNRYNRSDMAALGMPSVWGTPLGSSAPTLYTPGVDACLPNSSTPGTVSVTPSQLSMTFGGPQTYYSGGDSSDVSNGLGGGSIRANADLRLYGVLQVYLNPRYGEAVETSGRLLFDGYSQAINGQQNDRTQQPTELVVNRPDTTTATQVDTAWLYPTNAVSSSGASLFSTDQGVVRDGINASDASLTDPKDGTVVALSGYPRNVKRREPPIIDTINAQTKLTRYASLAQVGTEGVQGSSLASSTSAVSATSSASSTGSTSPTFAGYSGPFKQSGSIATVYVDNASDVQN